MRSTRDDPLARLQCRGQIDDAQYWGGRAFQRDFEIAERGPRAIDPAKEYVDGGLAPEPITENQRKSTLRLAAAYKELKLDMSTVVQDVLIHRKTMVIIAAQRGLPGRKWEEHFGKMFRDGLNVLAEFYGFSNNADDRRRPKVANPEALSRQIMILAARNAELLMALEEIARKKKMDAVAAVSMKAIAVSALHPSGIRV